MPPSEKKQMIAVACFILAAVLLAGVLWVAFSSCEASVFNRITGRNVTTWDAMFLELRVDDD